MNSKKRTRKPTTVGEMLEREFLIPLGISHEDFAKQIGEDIETVNNLLENRTQLTKELALKIGSKFGTSPEFWKSLQSMQSR